MKSLITMKLLFTFILLSSACFGQGKKAQIIALNNSIDSLELVLTTTRDNSVNDIEELNNEINQLKNDVSSLESSTTKLTKDNDKFKLDLAELSKKNLALEAKLKAIEVVNSPFEPSWKAESVGKEAIGVTKLKISLLDGKKEVMSFIEHCHEVFTDAQ